MSKLDFISRFTPSTLDATKVHQMIDKALSDDLWYVSQSAARNTRYKEYYPNGHE